MVKAVVFDMDGTLVNSKEAVVKQLSDFLSMKGLPPKSEQELVRLIGKTDWDIARTLVGDDEAKIEEAMRWFNTSHPKYYHEFAYLYPGTERCLKKLKSAGIKLGLASNATGEIVEQFIEWSGLGPLFDSWISPDGIAGKPAPDMLIAMARRLGVETAEMMYVGDTVFDVLAAKAARAVAVAVITGVGGVEELSATRPDLMLPWAAWLCPLLRLEGAAAMGLIRAKLPRNPGRTRKAPGSRGSCEKVK